MFGRVDTERGDVIDKKRADAANLQGTSTSERSGRL